MSYMAVTPEILADAAADVAGIGVAVRAASAAASIPTTGLLAAGADEVSAALAALFGAHAQGYQAVSVQVATFHQQFVRALTAAATSYAGAEAAAVSPLQVLLNVINAPTELLLRRPLIADGAPGGVVNGIGQPGGAGGLIFGNGGAGGSTTVAGGTGGAGGAAGLFGNGGAGGKGGPATATLIGGTGGSGGAGGMIFGAGGAGGPGGIGTLSAAGGTGGIGGNAGLFGTGGTGGMGGQGATGTTGTNPDQLPGPYLHAHDGANGTNGSDGKPGDAGVGPNQQVASARPAQTENLRSLEP
ncbi:PE family protein, partial [Mycobacterium szulgai]|uniref:PE family protein n=1 Tax=Mycobacterium szulgai TaxID=1787 RepID=UPI0035580ED6|nr:PE family protein [Mycobacterium szulgai]